MASKHFEILGVQGLLTEFSDLSKNIDSIIEPGVDEVAEMIEMRAKQNSPKEDGYLRDEIRVQLTSTGKGVTGRIGVLSASATDETGAKVALYGGVQEARKSYLALALEQTASVAEKKFESEVQKGLDRFHGRYSDTGDVSE